MARIVIAREHLDGVLQGTEAQCMRRWHAAVRKFSRKHPGAWCVSSMCFGRLFLSAYKHRSYTDSGDGSQSLPGYYRDGKFRPFTSGERIKDQNTAMGCQ